MRFFSTEKQQKPPLWSSISDPGSLKMGGPVGVSE